MTPEQVDLLREEMLPLQVVGETAVVVLSAKELDGLLSLVDLWEDYDEARSNYEILKESWESAVTTDAANSILAEVRLARYVYEKILSQLRKLGYHPAGLDPVQADHFKFEG